MEQAKKYAVKYIEVPPYAKFEIRWAAKEPRDLTGEQVLEGKYEDSGPMLIACLTD